MKRERIESRSFGGSGRDRRSSGSTLGIQTSSELGLNAPDMRPCSAVASLEVVRSRGCVRRPGVSFEVPPESGEESEEHVAEDVAYIVEVELGSKFVVGAMTAPSG
jgi:hypothetical protein